MTEHDRCLRISLLGGPLHRLGHRLGLVRGPSNTVALGLAIGWSMWLLMLILLLVEGRAAEVFVLPLVGAHARLLLVIPLMFVGESWLDPQARAFVGGLSASGVVDASQRPALAYHVDRLHRSKDAWWPDALSLAAAVLFWALGARLMRYGGTAVYDPNRAVFQDALAVPLYFSIVVTAFRFLVFRWILRLGLWVQFLWRISRMRLHLVPVHPDHAAGLGALEGVHHAFLPLVAALSVLSSASYAEEMSLGSMRFADVYPALALLAAVDLALVFGPLLFFTPILWVSKQRGLIDYMAVASEYVDAFERKWLRSPRATEPLLGSPDVQSLADLSTSINIVRDMRLLPASPRLLLAVLIAATVPVLPLWLFQYPLADLIQRFVASVLGV